jgi:hypothetical protein
MADHSAELRMMGDKLKTMGAELIQDGTRLIEIGSEVPPIVPPVVEPPIVIPPTPTVGGAKFGVNYATPREKTSWGEPLTAQEAKALRDAGRSFASHVLAWGITEDINTFNQYWTWRNPDVALLAKAPGWAKTNGDAYDEMGPMPSSWGRLTDHWAMLLAQANPKPKRAVIWSELRGVYPNGFWDLGRNRWAEDHYCNLWNMAAPKLKAAVPGIQVGGPYVGMSSWNTPAGATKGVLDVRDLDMISIFMQKCPTFDFIAVDGGIDLRPNYDLPAGTPEQHVEKLLDVLRWVRARTPKPFLWVETYMAGQRGGVTVKEHARAWPRLLDEAAKIPGESVWYTWASQRDMPDLATLQALAARP